MNNVLIIVPFFFLNKTKNLRTAFIKNTANTPAHYSITLYVTFLISDEQSVFFSNTGIRETVLYSLNFSEDVAGTSYSQRKLKLNVGICMNFSVQKGHRAGTQVLK